MPLDELTPDWPEAELEREPDEFGCLYWRAPRFEAASPQRQADALNRLSAIKGWGKHYVVVAGMAVVEGSIVHESLLVREAAISWRAAQAAAIPRPPVRVRSALRRPRRRRVRVRSGSRGDPPRPAEPDLEQPGVAGLPCVWTTYFASGEISPEGEGLAA